MPYDPLWVGQLAGLHTLEGQDCGTGGRPTGYSLCKGSIPLGGSPRLLSVTRALLPKRVFYFRWEVVLPQTNDSFTRFYLFCDD